MLVMLVMCVTACGPADRQPTASVSRPDRLPVVEANLEISGEINATVTSLYVEHCLSSSDKVQIEAYFRVKRQWYRLMMDSVGRPIHAKESFGPDLKSYRVKTQIAGLLSSRAEVGKWSTDLRWEDGRHSEQTVLKLTQGGQHAEVAGLKWKALATPNSYRLSNSSQLYRHGQSNANNPALTLHGYIDCGSGQPK